MRLPAQDAIIPVAKLSDYLLSPTHPEGSSKAGFLARLGYSRDNWRRLEADIREQLTLDAALGRASPYGQKYEILGLLTGPEWRHRPDPHRLDRPRRRDPAAVGDAHS